MQSLKKDVPSSAHALLQPLSGETLRQRRMAQRKATGSWEMTPDRRAEIKREMEEAPWHLIGASDKSDPL